MFLQLRNETDNQSISFIDKQSGGFIYQKFISQIWLYITNTQKMFEAFFCSY